MYFQTSHRRAEGPPVKGTPVHQARASTVRTGAAYPLLKSSIGKDQHAAASGRRSAGHETGRTRQSHAAASRVQSRLLPRPREGGAVPRTAASTRRPERRSTGRPASSPPAREGSSTEDRAAGASQPAKGPERTVFRSGHPGEAGKPSLPSFTVMILPQVHLRKPCYDFYFL